MKKYLIIFIINLTLFFSINSQDLAEYEYVSKVSCYTYQEFDNISNSFIPVIVNDHLLNQITDPYINIELSHSMNQSADIRLKPRIVFKNLGSGNFRFSGEISFMSPELDKNFGVWPYFTGYNDLFVSSETDWDYSINGMINIFQKVELGFEVEKTTFLSSGEIREWVGNEYITSGEYPSINYGNRYYNYYFNLLDIDLGWILPGNNSFFKNRRINKIQLFNKVTTIGNNIDSFNSFFATGGDFFPYINLSYNGIFEYWQADLFFYFENAIANMWLRPSLMNKGGYLKSVEVQLDITPMIASLILSISTKEYNAISSDARKRLLSGNMPEDHASNGALFIVGPGVLYTRESPVYIQQDGVFENQVSPFFAVSMLLQEPRYMILLDYTLGFNHPIENQNITYTNYSDVDIFSIDNFYLRGTMSITRTF